MSKFVILKNGKVIGRTENANGAREMILEEIKKTPRATFEIGRLLRRVSARISPPTVTVEDEELR